MKNNVYKDNIFINGPINVARLEGKINNINKVVYLFFDVHTNSTECENSNSIDVDKFIIKIFNKQLEKNSSIIYDFFIEVSPINNYEYHEKKPNNYFNSVRKLFYNLYKLNKEKTIKNIRLHYTDIRTLFDEYEYQFLTDVGNLSFQFRNALFNINITKEQFNIIDHLFNNLLNKINILKLSLLGKIEHITLNTHIDYNINYNNDMLKKFINNLVFKLKYTYKHNDIKEKIKILINLLILPEITKFENSIFVVKKRMEIAKIKIPQLSNKINYSYDRDSEISKYIFDLFLFSEKLSKIFMDLFAIFIDLYLLRRLLDKNYVNNSIYYSGAFHSINILYILVKYFDFKITHISKNNFSNINDLNDKIKNIEPQNINNVYDLFYEPRLYQCCNLIGFPKNFL